MKYKNPDPNLYRVFDHYNRKHFGRKLPRPHMLRYVQQPDKKDDKAMAVSTQYETGVWHVFLHEKLRGHPGYLRLTLVHEMVHLWGYHCKWKNDDNDCQLNSSKHHKKMIQILRKEADLC